MMEIPETLLEAVREHGREAYPEECCGALLGVNHGQDIHVKRVERLVNSRTGDRRRRYTIDPKEYARVEALASQAGLSLLGFYHSHPDHPAVPSDYDREHALPFFHYLVVAVAAGVPGKAAAWTLSEDRGVFQRETLVSQEPRRTS